MDSLQYVHGFTLLSSCPGLGQIWDETSEWGPSTSLGKKYS